MADHSTTEARVVCINCRFAAPTGSDEWNRAIHPSLGTLLQCPDCGSTNTTSR
jgi:hypothetical protein